MKKRAVIRNGFVGLGMATMLVLGPALSAGAVIKIMPPSEGDAPHGTYTCYIKGQRTVCLR
ncbi:MULTISPECIES: hypothetical protein [unclassified Microbacterium]|uniref:hypothetical protein n=1 Tax=unclassified Microbacterium TaxID=2609290 RepID=UPI000EA8B8BE|nr:MULTISPECIES: hypothetical protein [unclassified Microbacterium]MBT2486163.1 hypothetical protein [Microbacterium sp. ISL-108]RKN68889.1 hypothetical protein D7252_15770 [Microbacterium sp. CGR2]